MDATDILHQMGESLGSSASVKSVFGEPIQTEGKTVIPVARVAYGFGGGFGSGHHRAEDAAAVLDGKGAGEGGGGGGGIRAFPAGALEITQQGTRFIPFPDMRLLTGAFAAGMLLGGLILRRKARE
jgi:uncharacterized spore protein YtfJ